RLLAGAAHIGHERFDPCDLFGREKLLQMRRMAGLPAALALLLVLLRDRRRSVQRIGRWRRRGIGGIDIEPRFQHAQPPLQLHDSSVALSATRAFWAIHPAMLSISRLRSCAPFP